MIKEFIQKIINKHMVDYFVYVLSFIFIFGFLYFTGTITSGYHFIDDHGILNISKSLENQNFFQVVLDWSKNDLNIRFRPLYYLYYISTIKLFSQNFLAFSIFVGLLASFSFSFFYAGMRKLKHSVLTSFIFIFLIFCGSQMAIWWRLGTAETIGIFFLSLSFLFMAKCLDKNSYKLSNILFVIFIIIASLCKESFIIVIPAFVIFKIWNEQKVLNITLKESLKNNTLSILPFVIMIAEFLVIKFVVGTNQIGYAGLTSSMGEFITGVKNIILNPIFLLSWMKLLGVLIIIYILSLLFLFKKKKEELLYSFNLILIYLSFALMVIIPEIFMHAKSGMAERYLLPTTFGLAFLVIGIIQNTKQKFFKFLIILVTCIFIVISFNIAKTDAVLFADSGRDANSLLSIVKDKSEPDSKILLVVDPVDRFEVTLSIKRYLSFYGFDHFYTYPMAREYNSDLEIRLKKIWGEEYRNYDLETMVGVPDLIIIFDKNQTETFFNQNIIRESDYKNIFPSSENHAVYIRK